MSITAETAQAHAKDPAVLCCRAEAGITIEPQNLEDPSIFDELVDSGLLDLTSTLTIGEVLGATLTKTCDSLSPITPDVIDGVKSPVIPVVSETNDTPTPLPQIEGVATTVSGGRLIISIREGRDIHLEFPM